MQRGLLVLIVLCIMSLWSLAQPRVLQALKAVQPPHIDGNLNDAAWQQAPIAADFTQFFPNNGQSASARTEVKVLYDNSAIYISAYLYDNPELIHRQLTERDNELQAHVDYFSVFFDTYNDQQNGFEFLVTATNVQTDAKLGRNSYSTSAEYADKSWDAVWESKTSMQEDGWVVEMRIPYLSLRFAQKDIQTWGIQFLRYIHRNSESAFWNPVNPQENGFVNQFGKYTPLLNIQPPLRLSLSPYLSTGVRRAPDENGQKARWLNNGGMDIKYGINESFTLDATLIPDFGQIVSDNVITNLSPYEWKFQDNRPFFTEGTELFNKAGLFYSRRVGATPAGYYNVESLAAYNSGYEIVKNPAATQLYNAIKLSGRTQKKLGIGIFNAVTAPMRAEVHNNTTGTDSVIQTEPAANYNIIVLDQAFKNRSYITFTNTNVIRDGSAPDANVASLDFAFYNKANQYAVSGSAKYSSIFGLSPYSQYTGYEADTVSRNGVLFVKPYDGFYHYLKMSKVSGKVQYFVSENTISDQYNPNDLGYLALPNKVAYAAGISYNQYTPTKHFINYSYQLNLRYNWLYKPYAYADMEVAADALWLFKNMWWVSFTGGVFPGWQNDYFELRTPGRVLKKPWYFYTFLSGATDSRKRLYINYNLEFAKALLPHRPYYRTDAAARYRFSNRFNLSIELDRRHDAGQIGYAFRGADGEPVIGFRSFKDFTSTLSGTYNFTSRMNFSLRLRHYWSNVHYLSFHNVTKEGYYIDRPFVPNRDWNFNAFNVDAFFTWDFRAGSRLVAGWKNWLGDNAVDAYAYPYYFNNFKRTFDIPHGNELSVKFIYFLDYNQLRRKG